MDVELRPVTDEEFIAFSSTIGAAFGERPSDAEHARWRKVTELDRTLAVFDEGVIAATAGAFSFELTVPGGATVPVAGVTAVSVRPTHRRRGLLRTMMDRQLDDVAARGEPIAVLTASESAIYPRFGYGLATSHLAWKLATTGTTLASPGTGAGRVRIIEAPEATKVFPEVFDAVRRSRPGQVSRSEAFWETYFEDPADDREGASALFFAMHESPAGDPDGVVAYRRKGGWPGGISDHEILVEPHFYALDDDVEAALWSFLLSTDLVRTVSTTARPVDDTLRWRLADPRRIQVNHVGDHLWVRILDVAASLSARRYGTADRLVLDLVDPFRPANDGRWVVEGGPDGATSGRTAASTDGADLALGVDDLGAVYLGGVAPSVLARAGRIRELRPGALRRADAFFASDVAPFCSTEF